MKKIFILLLILFSFSLFGIKILISDTDGPHAADCEIKILAQCPAATTVIRIESLANSVTWALANGVDIINRSTTGIDDDTNENAGDDAWAGGIGIVHSFGADNTHSLYTHSDVLELDPCSRLDIICTVGGGTGGSLVTNYGAGLEFFYDGEATASYANAQVSGIICQLLLDNPTWSFFDARQALRQTASNYGTGWIADGGYGYVDYAAATAVAIFDLSPPTRISVKNYASRVEITWDKQKQTDFASTYVVYFLDEPTLSTVPSDGVILYQNTGESYTWNHYRNDTIWLGFYTEGSYSPLESYARMDYLLFTKFDNAYEIRDTEIGFHKVVIDTFRAVGDTLKLYHIRMDSSFYAYGGTGDMNDSGFLNAADAVGYLDYFDGSDTLTFAEQACADINGDGLINHGDVGMLMYMLNTVVGSEEYHTKKAEAIRKYGNSFGWRDDYFYINNDAYIVDSLNVGGNAVIGGTLDAPTLNTGQGDNELYAILGDLVTTAPVTGGVNDIFYGTDGTKATIAISNDGIGDTQLEYNTGQHLTTTSDVVFDSLYISGKAVIVDSLYVGGNVIIDSSFYAYGGTGDMTNEGFLNAADAQGYLDYFDGSDTLTFAEQACADINGDGLINHGDVGMLMYMLNTVVGSEEYHTKKAEAIRKYGNSFGWRDDYFYINNDAYIVDSLNVGGKVTIGIAAAGVDYTLTFDGEDDDCVITYDEDNNKLDFGNTNLFTTGSIRGLFMEVDIPTHKASHENEGGDEIDVDDLSGLLADDQHVLDAEVSTVITADVDKAFVDALDVVAATVVSIGGHNVNALADITSAGADIELAVDHKDLSNNPHATDIENLGAGTLAELNAALDETLINTNDGRLSDSRQCDNTFDNAGTSKTALSLNNVENKSSATIRGEIAEEDIPDAMAEGKISGLANKVQWFGADGLLDFDKIDGAKKPEDNATKYPNAGEQAFLDADHTKLNGIEDNADVSPNLPSDENLVGYWSFDEGKGSKAYDGSGNSNDGTLENMEEEDWVKGIVGKCLAFDGGEDEYVDCGTNVLSENSRISFNVWLNYANNGKLQFPLRARDSGDHNVIAIYINSSNQVRIGICTTNDGNIYTSYVSLSQNVWHMVTGIYNNSILKMYIDGNYQRSINATGNLVSEIEFLIGNYGLNVLEYSLNGKIDEVRIYDETLTVKELLALYKYPAGNKGVIAWESIVSDNKPEDNADVTATYLAANNYHKIFIGAEDKTGAVDGDLWLDSGVFKYYDADGEPATWECFDACY